jgi:SAM-dependent methyltransferase
MDANITILVEQVKPIPVRVTDGFIGQMQFSFRRAVDLQLQTIWRFLGPILPELGGDLLDVGCGEMPFRFALSDRVKYTGIDVEAAIAFGMAGDGSIHVFDGLTIPFPDNHFDHVLCTEVLEHAEEPGVLMLEMHRVLKPGGSLILTVPFSARVHHAPYDFHRFTSYRLMNMLTPFAKYNISARGNDVAAIANKLIVLCMGLLRPSFGLFWRAPLALMCLPVAGVFLLAAHACIFLEIGSKDDPLGYAVQAFKGG